MREVILHGAALGFTVYGVYDFTNLATLRGWSILVNLVDLMWGTLLCATACAISVWAAKALGV